MKRLLFVTYYFPPSGGPGVQRSLKFAKYLPEFGWRPTVLTVRPERAAWPDPDPDSVADIPEGISVERTGAWDPYAWYARLLRRRKQDVISVGFAGEAGAASRRRFARWIRANVFLPDARVGWVPFAAARARALLKQPFDALLTTGPPHSAHLAGLAARGRLGTPWLVDLRDPWTEIDFRGELPATAPARGLDAFFERRVLRAADGFSVVSPGMQRRFVERGYASPELIENGFDPADFAGEAPRCAAGDAFVVAHVGNMNRARNPEALWKALSASEVSDWSALRLRFTGNVDASVLASAAACPAARLNASPYVSHRKAIERMREATLLLLCVNRVRGAEGIPTGKLYEYLASGRPVLGLGPPQGDAARILEETGGGRMFDFEDAEGARAFLRRHYEAWRAGAPLRGAPPDRLERYSRREQTRRLAALLSSLADRPQGTRGAS